MDRRDIVEVLEEIAVLLELKGENVFKVRAYQNGARALETLEDDLDELIESGELGKVKGMGKALVDKVSTLRQTGELAYYTDLKASVPSGLLDLLDIPGLGAKKIKVLQDKLGVASLEDLQRVAEAGEIAGLAGFGARSQEKILTGIRNREAYAARHLWWDAEAASTPILEGLRALPEVVRAEAAGSLRRGKETVGDLDFLAASSEPEPIMAWFCAQNGVVEVTARGETKSSVRLEGGLQADLRVVPDAQYAFALHHFTGSKEHNVIMRQRALSRGYSLSEWGLSPKDEESAEAESSEARAMREGIHDEAGLFDFLGLSTILPELREGRDELDRAEAGAFPELVTLNDIQGVFHNHTTASDGRNTLEEMVDAAQAQGWKYLGLADHSKASFQANGLDEDRVRKQLDEVRALNASGRFSCHVFAGIECDILPDGSLDLADDLLAELDYVVVSVHSSFTLSEADQTARIIRAMEHPSATMLGHLTGRLLLRREPYAVDVQAIVEATARLGKSIELNAHPMRLDMDWRHWRRAADAGVPCAINPDAHAVEGYKYMKAGVLAARKAGLTPADVLNTRSLAEVEAWLLNCKQNAGLS